MPDLREVRLFCTAKSYEEMTKCKFYMTGALAENRDERWKMHHLPCKYLDDVIGMYDGKGSCKCEVAMQTEEMDLSELGHATRERSQAIRHSNAEKNETILLQNGIKPEKDGVKYIDVSATWVIRIPGKPRVDFFASKNKWRDINSGQLIYGDARQLILYLNSGGKKGGRSKP